MRRRLSGRSALLAVSALLALAPTPVAADAASAERIQRILEYGDFQRELPGAPELPEVQVPPQDLAVPVRPEVPSSPSAGSLSLVNVLLWTLGIGAVVLLLVLLLTRLRLPGRRADEAAAPVESGPAGSSGRSAPPMDEADRLAAEGRWAEAIHLLLLRAFEQLKRRPDFAAPPALTSRELLRRLALPERAAAALGAMVALVERSHFGGKPVGAADYDTCRGHYRALVDHARAAAQ